MEIDIEQEIISVTDLKRRTKDVVMHVRQSKRPVIVTVNGRADVVLMSAKTYEKLKRSADFIQTFKNQNESHPPVVYDAPNSDPMNGQTFRKFKDFWQELKNVYKVDA